MQMKKFLFYISITLVVITSCRKTDNNYDNPTFITVDSIRISLEDYLDYLWMDNDIFTFKNDSFKIKALIAQTLLAIKAQKEGYELQTSEGDEYLNQEIDFQKTIIQNIEKNITTHKNRNILYIKHIWFRPNDIKSNKKKYKKIIRKEKSFTNIWNYCQNEPESGIENVILTSEFPVSSIEKSIDKMDIGEVKIEEYNGYLHIIQLDNKKSCYVPTYSYEKYNINFLNSLKKPNQKYTTEKKDSTEISEYIYNRIMNRGLPDNILMIISNDTMFISDYRLLRNQLPNYLSELMKSEEFISKIFISGLLPPFYYRTDITGYIKKINQTKDFILQNFNIISPGSSTSNTLNMNGLEKYLNCRISGFEDMNIKINFTLLKKIEVRPNNKFSAIVHEFINIPYETQTYLMSLDNWSNVTYIGSYRLSDADKNNISAIKLAIYREISLAEKFDNYNENNTIADKDKLNDIIDNYLNYNNIYSLGYIDNRTVKMACENIYKIYVKHHICMESTKVKTNNQKNNIQRINKLSKIYYYTDLQTRIPYTDVDSLNLYIAIYKKEKDKKILKEILKEMNTRYKIKINNNILGKLGIPFEKTKECISDEYQNTEFTSYK